MAFRIARTRSGSAPDEFEIRLVSDEIARAGRCTLIVPTSDARDTCRRVLADAGCGIGADVVTPAQWIEGLWGLLGDGRRPVGNLQRQLVMASVVASRPADTIAPLRANPGTCRMLARMARDLAGAARHADGPDGIASATVLSLLADYIARLDALDLIEPAEAGELAAQMILDRPLACASSVLVRDVTTLPAYLEDLLAAVAQTGEVHFLLRGEQRVWADGLASAFKARGCAVALAGESRAAGDRAGMHRVPGFLEVAGPHARPRAYADGIARLISAAGTGAQAVVVCARPAELFDDLSAHLAARGVDASVTRFVRFPQTLTGRHLDALWDLVRRMKAARDGEASDTEWWPASELTDWLYAPLSGVDASFARAFDKKVRGNRALGVEGVLREVQSVQSRAAAARRKLPEGHPMRRVPVVCSDVVQFLWQDRPVSALKSMLSAIEALPASAFGTRDGRCRQTIERAMVRRALDVLSDEAHALGVSQAVAVSVLEGLCVASREHGVPTGGPDTLGHARFMTLAEAAELAPASVDALFMADVDVASYPLSHEEGPLVALSSILGRSAQSIEPAALVRDRARRAFDASRGQVMLSRVTHDRQAKDRYPAALWTELAAMCGLGKDGAARTGEGDVAGDFDPAGPLSWSAERIACCSPQRLEPAARAYLVPRRRTESGALAPQQFSASQIESYAGCPLCWFISSRIRPNSIDAGFTNMEKGNFVHDIMDRFHGRLIDEGMRRVTPENLTRSLGILDEVFSVVRDEHARGKTASSAALVPLSHTERAQVDDILPQLRKVVRYEAGALAPFAPAYLEYSFNGLGVDYAGWPLGGRIDRVDVDAEGRAVVIDYKHRSDANPFKLKDPTVPLKKTGEVPADDPRWLPEHTQTLIYAQALRRALGLDVRGALYFSTKGKVVMRGAASAELVEEEPGDGRVPGLRDGFPAADAGGTMGFDALLDRVEAGIAGRLGELADGIVAASGSELASCARNHPIGFTRREA